ncbi:MerR family transcriptional regulator [Kribbella sp. NBC_00889]|uniref:MerR family transcriptional regulator n=1 Tax=Kribbella sp. NBC_00889 TaxID=2975974 RepID=UPI003866694B|nr:MerR family transcriptional regulator [Kribbella sp. NBC_00889]
MPNVPRHWESRGLLAHARVEADRRLHSDADRYRVAPIVCAKEAGLRLDAIREILNATN